MFSISASVLQDEFEAGDIPCRVARHSSKCLMPIGSSLPDSDHGLIEIVIIGDGFESVTDEDIAQLQPRDINELKTWLEEGYNAYLKTISPEGFIDRCEDWLLEVLGLTQAQAVEIYKNQGITAFMRIDRVVFCMSELVTCIDVTCFGDVYLWDFGFNIDRAKGVTWNVSPRLNLICDTIYPATEAYDAF